MISNLLKNKMLAVFFLAILSCEKNLDPVVNYQSARYQLDFVSTWSMATHPTNYPANAHYSPIFGVTHTAAISLWNPGELASAGIEEMAELGATDLLNEFAKTQQSMENIGTIFIGERLDTPINYSIIFDIDVRFSQVTAVSMLAPSPDWFIGVSGLNLYENGKWVEQISIDLPVYDAGTDNGAVYRSANDDANPAMPITLLSASQTDFLNGTPTIGTFIFTRID